MLPKFRSKSDILARLIRHPGITSQGVDLDSAVMADGLVTFVAEERVKNTVDGRWYKTGDYDIRVVGWPTEPETRIDTLQEAIEYIWANRRRISYETMEL